jgi:hypothetical protein|tara:strand:+ start:461 stop:700 length:240 start_codon:yes stop_codon:yes gene_type:complete
MDNVVKEENKRTIETLEDYMRNLSESNFDHTEDEWGSTRKFTGKEKKYCECPSCKDTMESRKKNFNSQRIIAYTLNDSF